MFYTVYSWFGVLLLICLVAIGVLIGAVAQLNSMFNSCKNHGAYTDGDRAIMCVVSNKGKQ